jgi:hypothetical protein
VQSVPQPPKAFHDSPEGKALICVVDTLTYETASYCFSAVEMALLNDTTDFRPRTWLLMDKDEVERLSRFRAAP